MRENGLSRLGRPNLSKCSQANHAVWGYRTTPGMATARDLLTSLTYEMLRAMSFGGRSFSPLETQKHIIRPQR